MSSYGQKMENRRFSAPISLLKGDYGLSNCSIFLRNRRYIWVLSTILFLFIIYQFNPLAAIHTQRGRSWPVPTSLTKINRQRISNGTLGFGAIYALSLPDRSDKRDAMEVSAALTGLKLTWAEGVKGDTMHPKAIPPAHSLPISEELKTDGELGCWRGHMNIIRDVVKSGLSSALIIEDDADWDVHIVRQMEQLASASQAVLASARHLRPGRKEDHKSESPYGYDWDIIWIGHCGGWPPNPRFHPSQSAIHGDRTVPPAFDIVDLTSGLSTSNNTCSAHQGRDPTGRTCDSPRLAPDERIVQLKGSPICTTGYAVSQQGARKMLARMGGIALVDADANMDTELTELCRGDKDGPGAEETRCLSVSPPYIVSHKPRGSNSGDSDINTISDGEERKIGVSRGLVWSTKMNTENLIAGLEPESQYVLDVNSMQWRYKTANEYRAYERST